MTVSQGAAERGRPPQVRCGAAPLLTVALAALVSSCGETAERGAGSADARAMVETTAAGTVIARATDRAHGLVFEVESSPKAEKTFLSVTLTGAAPPSTRAAVLHHVLAGECPVPGEPILTLFGRRDTQRQRFTTEIAPDDPTVVVARRATHCELYVGRPGATRETAVFPKRPFSRVRMP